MLPIRTILHPTDFSDVSQHAFELAGSLARDTGARLVVLHVLQPPPLITYGEMERALEQADGYRQELRQRLLNLRCADPGVVIE